MISSAAGFGLKKKLFEAGIISASVFTGLPSGCRGNGGFAAVLLNMGQNKAKKNGLGDMLTCSHQSTKV
jgi:hypothetical protein